MMEVLAGIGFVSLIVLGIAFLSCFLWLIISLKEAEEEIGIFKDRFSRIENRVFDLEMNYRKDNQ